MKKLLTLKKAQENLWAKYCPIAVKLLTMALQKIKLEKDVNPMKILAVVEVKFKQSLSKEKKVEVVRRCTGDNYAQIIVVTDKVS